MSRAALHSTKDSPTRQTGWAVLHLLLLLWLGLATIANCAANEKENQKKLKELLKEIDEVKVALEKKSSRHSTVEKAMASAELRIGQLSRQRRELRQQQDQLDRSLAALTAEQEALQGQLNQQKQLISEQLVSHYKAGEQNPIQLLLENGNPADIDRQLEYLERVNTARRALLENYRELLLQQQQNADNIREQQQALENTLATLEQKRTELAGAQSERSTTLARLKQEMGSEQARIDKLQQDHSALQTLVERMSRAVARRPASREQFQLPANIDSFADARGQLPWPVAGKTRSNADKQWQGVTIAAKKGSSVQAIFPGRVVFADWFRGQGLLIILDHGDNFWSLYGHNESLMKSPGDTVVAGEPIATVGDSGGQNQSALYFEIRHKGKPVKPRQWCKS